MLGLVPPAPSDVSAEAYKDWLHFNIFDHGSGTAGLVNVSLHGPPHDGRSRVVGTALFHHRDHGWVGNVDVGGYDDATVGPSSIGTPSMALAVNTSGSEGAVSVRMPNDGDLVVDVAAESAEPAIAYEHRLPLGSGWISWQVNPRLVGTGHVSFHDQQTCFDDAAVYHDRNWGRWHWGDDLGWQWGCFLAPAGGPAVVFSRTTDRAHRNLGVPTVHVAGIGRLRRFHQVTVERRGRLTAASRRVPGAVAALHQDRRRSHLPAEVRIEAALGRDRVVVEFAARAAAQIVAPDPVVRGYSFIHESVGEGVLSGVVDGRAFTTDIMGVLEHVS